MRHLFTPVVALGLLATCFPSLAKESEIQMLKRQVRELNERYEAQRAATAVLEARLRRQEELRQEVSSPRDSGNNYAGRSDGGSARAAGTQLAQAGGDRPASKSSDGEVIRQPPQSSSAQAVYQEQSGGIFGESRRFTFETGLTYSHYDTRQLALNGFLALDAIFLGQINVDRIRANLLTWDLTGRYSLSDRAQIDLNLPVVYRYSTFESGGAGGASSSLSEVSVRRSPHVGDVNAGFYYKLLAESSANPDVVWNIRLKAPTGEHPYGVKMVPDPSGNTNLNTPAELPTGNGLWSVSTGLSFVKTVDPAILFANVSYFHNIRRHFDDISPSSGSSVPGYVKLGDSIQWGVGAAFALNDRTSLSMSFAQMLSDRATTEADGGSKNKIIGSNANAATFNVGLTHALSDRTTMVGSMGVGLTPDAPNFTIGVKFPHTF